MMIPKNGMTFELALPVATAARLEPARRHRSLRAFGGPFATATAVAAVLALPRDGLAGPNGGSVVAGSAAISQAGSTTTINQSSTNAIINWQGFSIGTTETVNFNQPGATSATLNRVIGNEQSVIDGALNANGRVFIVNSNGVLFGKNAQVNVGGLTASTLDISNADFMAGKYTFSGTSAASVVNQGRIKARDGGYVALLGKTVSNDGVIVAKMGTVAMASGEKITLNFDGNSLVDVTIDQGALNALVENKRAIKADGGRVILTAKAADKILSAQVNNSGIIQARTMAALKGGGSGKRAARKGSIKLLAQGGTVNVSGKLDASAPKKGDGGFIETSGDKVKIADSAVVTTQAANGVSGSWLIDPDGFTIAAVGGDITGATLSSELANTSVTILSIQGHGADGNVNVNDKITWSSDTTLTLNATNAINVNAILTAQNGGLVLNAGTDINVNAPSSLQVATINATAALGPAGTGDINFNAPQTWTSNGAWTFSGTNVNINDAVNWSDGTLTLKAGAAGGFINLNAVMTASNNASLVLTYNTGIDTTTVNGLPNGNPTESYGTPLGGINPLLDTDPASKTFGTYIGRIDFLSSDTAATPLTINGDVYTLITSVRQLDMLDNQDASVAGAAAPGSVTGKYALATDLDACGAVSEACASAVTYSNALISLGASGVLEGLGHNIAGFKLEDTARTVSAGSFGLIGTNLGTIRDLSLTNVDISVAHRAGGALVGNNMAPGMIINAAVSGGMLPDGTTAPTGGVSVQNNVAGTTLASVAAAGGMVGTNTAGIIYNGWTDVHVDALNVNAVGGLAGLNSAQGRVVAGVNQVGAVISNSSSIGTVESHLNTSNLQQPTSGSTSGTGGLVGANAGGTLSHDSSSSVVIAGTATGILNQVGGLVGNNSKFNVTGYGGSIFSSVADGRIVYDGGNVGVIGGLAGGNTGLIDNSFSSTALPSDRGGGFVGSNLGTLTNNTWDPASSGKDSGATNGTTPPGLSTGTGPSPGQGPAPSNGTAQAAAARSQAQALTQQAAAQQAAIGQAQVAVPAANAVAAAALTAATSAPPSGALSAAGTPAASGSPASAAVNASLGAVQTSVQADDQRLQRRARVAAAAASQRRRPGLGATIRNIEINGRRFDPNQRNDDAAPGHR